MRKRIRLTEGDLHKIIRESVKRILKEESPYMQNGAFNNAAYMYDSAYEMANTPEEFDTLMKGRKDYLDSAAYNGIEYHPQTTSKYGKNMPSTGAMKYSHPELFGVKPENLEKELGGTIEYNKKQHGFPF